MKTIQNIKDDFYMTDYHTGGGCMALFCELNTLQDYILVTAEDAQIPTDDDTQFYIGLYLHDGDGTPAHMFETTNIDHLYMLIESIGHLWGNA